MLLYLHNALTYVGRHVDHVQWVLHPPHCRRDSSLLFRFLFSLTQSDCPSSRELSLYCRISTGNPMRKFYASDVL